MGSGRPQKLPTPGKWESSKRIPSGIQISRKNKRVLMLKIHSNVREWKKSSNQAPHQNGMPKIIQEAMRSLEINIKGTLKLQKCMSFFLTGTQGQAQTFTGDGHFCSLGLWREGETPYLWKPQCGGFDPSLVLCYLSDRSVTYVFGWIHFL